MNKLHVKTGDTVVILSGKDKIDTVGCLWDFVLDGNTRITGDRGIAKNVIHVHHGVPP